MCGIVGLLIKRPAQRELLGRWIAPMLVCMGERGPDSAGLATFSSPQGDALRYSLFTHDEAFNWNDLALDLARSIDHCRRAVVRPPRGVHVRRLIRRPEKLVVDPRAAGPLAVGRPVDRGL